MARAAKMRKDVVTVAVATKTDLATEMVEHAIAGLYAPVHRCPGYGRPHDRHRSGHHVDECAFDPFDLRAELNAKETVRSKVERHLLDRGIETHLSLPWPPSDPGSDADVETLEIGLHRPGLESNGNRAPMQAMLVEIEHHQAAGEQPLEVRVPTQPRGEQLSGVQEYKFVGIGAEQGDVSFAKRAT